MNQEFTQKEIDEARNQLCFNMCSHYDLDFNCNWPEKSLIKMTIEDGLPPWLTDIMIDEFSKN